MAVKPGMVKESRNEETESEHRLRSPLVMLGVLKVGLGFSFFILERHLVML